jgi:Ala-tRNA(Pro) deacylase
MDPSSRSQSDVSEALPSPEVREAALYRHLVAVGIGWKTYGHEPAFTVEQARDLRGTIAGGHTKNLFLKDRKDGLWLIVLREDLRVDLNALARQLDSPRFSFGSGELLAATLGVPPGAVTPFALLNDSARNVRLVLDEDLLKLNPLNFHPLRNDKTTAIAASDLVRFVGSCGHTAMVVRLPELAR